MSVFFFERLHQRASGEVQVDGEGGEHDFLIATDKFLSTQRQ